MNRYIKYIIFCLPILNIVAKASESFFDAVRNGSLKDVKRLHKQNQNSLNSKDKNGSTALMAAAESGRLNVFMWLIQNAKNGGLNLAECISTKDNDGNNVFHHAAIGGNLDILKYLTEEHKSLLESKNNKNETPLIVANKSWHFEAVMFLIRKGAKAKGECAKKAISYAAEKGNIDVIKSLLEQDPKLIESTYSGKTPLISAARHGSICAAQFLIEKGADITETDADADNAFLNALEENQIEFAKYLLNKHSDFLKSTGYIGNTPLIVAAKRGSFETVEWLMNEVKNANIDLEEYITKKNNHDENVFHYATIEDCDYIIHHLLQFIPSEKQKATIDLKNNQGETPLMWAADHGSFKSFYFLIEKGADITATNKSGQNVFLKAVCGRNVEITDYLLSTDSKLLYSKDNDGKTAMDYARGDRHNFAIFTLLEQKLNSH